MSLVNVGIFLIGMAALYAVSSLLMSRRLRARTFALLAAVRNHGWTDENRARLNRFRHTARKAAKMAPASTRYIPINDRSLDSMPWLDVLAWLFWDLRKAGFDGRTPPGPRQIEDARMDENHLSRLKPDLFGIGIGRDKVESNDISQALSTLAQLFADPDTVRRSQGRVAILFEGYDDDPRAVYEIPEVRRFCATLDKRFPYWFYFLTTMQDNLKVVTFCLVQVKVHRHGRIWVDADDLERFLFSHLSAMNTVFDRYSLGNLAERLPDVDPRDVKPPNLN